MFGVALQRIFLLISEHADQRGLALLFSPEWLNLLWRHDGIDLAGWAGLGLWLIGVGSYGFYRRQKQNYNS